jgi:hypothetical protein
MKVVVMSFAKKKELWSLRHATIVAPPPRVTNRAPPAQHPCIAEEAHPSIEAAAAAARDSQNATQEEEAPGQRQGVRWRGAFWKGQEEKRRVELRGRGL